MNDLGESCLRLENEGFTAELESTADRSLTFETLQEIRNIESKILTAKSILTATSTTLQNLEAVAIELDSRHSYHIKESKRQHPDNSSRESVALARLSRQCHSYSESAEVMESRAARLIDLLSDGLDQKAQGTSAEINSSLLNLTQRSVDENVTVRVVTIITLIYLPTQFVAVSLRSSSDLVPSPTLTACIMADLFRHQFCYLPNGAANHRIRARFLDLHCHCNSADNLHAEHLAVRNSQGKARQGKSGRAGSKACLDR